MNAQHIADEILVAFAADELTPTDAQIVASHTASCAECAKTVARFKTIRFLVRTDESRDPPLAAVMQVRSIFRAYPTLDSHITEEQLVAWAAGELNAPDAQMVAEHLAQCVDCSKTATTFKTIFSAMRTTDSHEPPRLTVMRARSIFRPIALSPHIAYDQLIAFAADDLDESDASIVAQHTASCNECARIVTRFKTIRAVMRADPSKNPPAAVVARARSIFTQKRSAASVPFWQKWKWSISAPTARRLANAFLVILLVLSNLIVYIGMGRTVEASQVAIPGDSLYPIKLVIEDVQLATTWDTAGKLTRHLAYAGYRLDETGALTTLDRLAEVPSALGAFEKQVGLVTTTFKTLARENFKRAQELTPQIESKLADYSTQLETYSKVATVILLPAFEHAIQVSKESQTRVHEATSTPLPTTIPIAVPPPTNTLKPDSSPIRPNVPTATTLPASLPSTSPIIRSPTPQPMIVRSPTPSATSPIVRSPTPTRSPTVTLPTPSPSATRTVGVPSPSPIPQPSQTPRPTHIPPGLEKKTLTPVPWNQDK